MSKPFSALARLKSITHALSGIRILIAEEHNARVHLFATALAGLLGVLLDVSATQWLILIIVIALVWITEALNTALENLSDRVCAEPDPFIGKAKDVAASAVLIASVAAVLCGGIIFLPKILSSLGAG